MSRKLLPTFDTQASLLTLHPDTRLGLNPLANENFAAGYRAKNSTKNFVREKMQKYSLKLVVSHPIER